MPIRKILVPLLGTDVDRTVLNTGLAVAKNFGAQVVGLFVRPDPSEALPYLGDGVSGQVIEDLLQAAKEGADAAAARAKSHLNSVAETAGLPVVEKGNVILPSACFVEKIGRRDMVVTEESRLSDLVLFGDDGSDGGLAGDVITGDALEAALMSAGRPILIAPHTQPKEIGKTIAIGWDDSSEAAHAVTAAIPFLKQAAKVVILCIGGDELDPGPGSTLADYLALHGVQAGVHLVDAGGRFVGEVLLEQAGQCGADLMVMGGYGHSRLRELIIGGATRHVRSHATLAVLMSH